MDSSTTRPTPSRPSRSTTVCTPFGPLAVRNTRPDGASPTSKKSRPTSTPAAHNAVIAQLLCSSLSATRFAPATVRKSTLASAPLPASRRQNQGPNELRSPAIKPQPDHHANTQGPKLSWGKAPAGLRAQGALWVPAFAGTLGIGGQVLFPPCARLNGPGRRSGWVQPSAPPRPRLHDAL